MVVWVKAYRRVKFFSLLWFIYNVIRRNLELDWISNNYFKIRDMFLKVYFLIFLKFKILRLVVVIVFRSCELYIILFYVRIRI